MDELSKLKPPAGAKRGRKRRGRGEASGLGKTAGRGHKGLKARSGGKPTLGYEGGQMRLIRRLPKRGFTSKFRKEYKVVSVRDLSRFEAGSVVDPEALVRAGLVSGLGRAAGVKILATGEVTRALTVRAHKFSGTAKEKIEAAGGKAEVI